jgi:hypothetical protein
MNDLTVGNETKKQIIEVNGIKMEVDMRYVKRVDHFKVGDRVRLLKKEYSDSHVVLNGVIVGFEPFKKLPTIIVATIEQKYDGSKLEFHYINSKNDEKEIVPAVDDFIPIKKEAILDHFDTQIEKKTAEIEGIKNHREYFLKHFNMYFLNEVEREG